MSSNIFSESNFEEAIVKFVTQKINNIKEGDDLKDILLNEYIETKKESFRKSKIIKQIQMITGKVWQEAIGLYPNFVNLGEGHISGLDNLNEVRKIILELKNRYNTDNASAKKSNYSKLVKYKKENSDYEVIYAVINDTKYEGKKKEEIIDGVKIIYLSGDKLLTYIFENNKEIVIHIIKKVINKLITHFSEKNETKVLN